jgi:outer membrane receptor protein involved in Fe transport
VAYSLGDARPTLRGSVNRLFQPPQPEYLLLSSSPAARALSPFAGNDDGGADLEPERQAAWEAGVEQWIARAVRIDAAYWHRRVRNYADPNIFLGTTVVFPNSIARGVAKGFDLRVEAQRRRGLSGYVGYTHARVLQFGPINGGLFLEEEILEIGPGTPFVPDHDQRHTASAGISYEHPRGFAAAIAGRYESGTPLEVGEEAEAFLAKRPGAALVNFDTGRVRPRTLVDLTLSQMLRRRQHGSLSIRASVLNLTNRAYALNFGNPFSGTHFGAPRTVMVEVGLGL